MNVRDCLHQESVQGERDGAGRRTVYSRMLIQAANTCSTDAGMHHSVRNKEPHAVTTLRIHDL